MWLESDDHYYYDDDNVMMMRREVYDMLKYKVSNENHIHTLLRCFMCKCKTGNQNISLDIRQISRRIKEKGDGVNTLLIKVYEQFSQTYF